MNALAQEVAQLVESIPPDKARTIVEFARFVAERDDADAWERRFQEPRVANNLRAEADRARADLDAGRAEDLDPDTL